MITNQEFLAERIKKMNPTVLAVHIVEPSIPCLYCEDVSYCPLHLFDKDKCIDGVRRYLMKGQKDE